jgi:hypothetical protein
MESGFATENLSFDFMPVAGPAQRPFKTWFDSHLLHTLALRRSLLHG